MIDSLEDAELTSAAAPRAITADDSTLSLAPQVIAFMLPPRMVDSFGGVERDGSTPSLVFKPSDLGFGRPAMAACAT